MDFEAFDQEASTDESNTEESEESEESSTEERSEALGPGQRRLGPMGPWGQWGPMGSLRSAGRTALTLHGCDREQELGGVAWFLAVSRAQKPTGRKTRNTLLPASFPKNPTTSVTSPPQERPPWRDVQEDLVDRDGNGRIVALRELMLSQMILMNHAALLCQPYDQGTDQPSTSLADLAVRFGHKDFAERLVLLGVPFKCLTLNDLVEQYNLFKFRIKDRPFRAALAAGQAQAHAAVFLRNLRASGKVPVSLLDLAIECGEPQAAEALARLGVGLHAHLIQFFQMRDAFQQSRSASHDFELSWRKILAALCAGVDPDIFTREITNSKGEKVLCQMPQLSILDFVLIHFSHLSQERKLFGRGSRFGLSSVGALVQWIVGLGASSKQGEWLGTCLLEVTHRGVVSARCGQTSNKRLAVNLQAAKALAAAGIDLKQVKVDVPLALGLKFGDLEPSSWTNWHIDSCRDSITLLGMAITLGQPDVAAYLSQCGCEHSDLIPSELECSGNGFRQAPGSFHLPQMSSFDRMVAAKAAISCSSRRYRMLLLQISTQVAAKLACAILDERLVDRIVKYASPLPSLSVLDFVLPLPREAIERIGMFVLDFVDRKRIFVGAGPRVEATRMDTSRASVPSPALFEAFDDDNADMPDDVSRASHYEPVAEITPDEADRISHERWASWVEHWAVDVSSPAPTSLNTLRNQLLLLTFSRHPRELEDALLNSALARRASAQGVNVMPAWARGAKIFAAGVDAGCFEHDLGPYNVVLRQEDEATLHEELQALPYHIRKLKSPCVAIPGPISLLDVSENRSSLELSSLPDAMPESNCSDDAAVTGADEEQMEITVRRTFIHVAVAANAEESQHSWP